MSFFFWPSLPHLMPPNQAWSKGAMWWPPSLLLWSRIHCEYIFIYMCLLTSSHRLSMHPSKPLVDTACPPQQTPSTTALSAACVTSLPRFNDCTNTSRESPQINQAGTGSGFSKHTGKLWILTESILTSILDQTWIQAHWNHQCRCYLDRPYNHPHRWSLGRLYNQIQLRRRRHGIPCCKKVWGKCHNCNG